MAFKDTKHKGFVSNYTGNGIHSFGAFQYFQINDPSGTLDPYTGQVKVLDIATKAGLYSSTDTGSNITEVVYDPFSLQISAENATLSNVTVWSANSILTQSRADSRYIADSIVGCIPTSYGNDVFYGQYQTRHASPGFPFVSGGLLSFSRGIVGVSNTTDPCNIEFHPGESFNQMRFRSYDKIIVLNNDGFSVETGTANWTWSANSILTQGRGDARYQANGSYLNDVLTNVTTSYGTDSVRGMQKGYGGPNFVAGKLFVGSVGMVGMVSGNETAGVEFMTGGVFNSIRIRQFAHTVILSNSGFEVETGTANWTWSDNSILTQGRGDARYQPIGSYLANATTWLTTDSGTDQIIGLQSNTSTYQTFSGTGVFGSSYLGVRTLASNTAISYIKCDPIAAPFGRVTIFHNGTTFTFNSRGISVGSTANFTWGSNDFSTVGFNDARYQNAANNTWANLTGKPTLANVATSGDYNDLSNTPASYTLPAATNSTLGGIIVGSGLSITNGTLSATGGTGNIDGGSATTTGTGSYDGGSATTN